MLLICNASIVIVVAYCFLLLLLGKSSRPQLDRFAGLVLQVPSVFPLLCWIYNTYAFCRQLGPPPVLRYWLFGRLRRWNVRM